MASIDTLKQHTLELTKCSSEQSTPHREAVSLDSAAIKPGSLRKKLAASSIATAGVAYLYPQESQDLISQSFKGSQDIAAQAAPAVAEIVTQVVSPLKLFLINRIPENSLRGLMYDGPSCDSPRAQRSVRLTGEHS